MFTAATLRLTGWYVAILMGLSLAFSVWLYAEAMGQIREGFNGPIGGRIQYGYTIIQGPDVQDLIDQQVAAGHQHIIGRLVLLNVGILFFGGIASYALARRTLQPIEAAVEAQNRFTADASHELRTPLAAMKTEIEIALRQPELSKTEVHELLQSNLEEVDRMSSLSQGLLTLARSEAPPRVSAVHAEKTITAVIKRLKPLAKVKEITIVYTPQPLKVLASSKYLDTIMGTLLDNAIKYSPPKTTITVHLARDDGHGVMSVSDQGYGIASADVPHIFDRFYRSDSSRSKENVAGHGLGLSIAHKMTTAIKGTIAVRSTEGKGSTFSVRLPIAQ
jgi:signal transduction histidine kinase